MVLESRRSCGPRVEESHSNPKNLVTKVVRWLFPLVFDEILYIEVAKVAGYESATYFAKKQNGGPEIATIFFINKISI
jgi:hypothetical protein